MKKAIVRASSIVLGASAILLTAPAAARADERIIATVPFEFVVGDVHMPAGGYVVTRMSANPSVMSISSMSGQHVTLVLTIPASSDDTILQPELVFERFGTQYYLARIVPQGGDGREIVLSPSVRKQEVQSVSQVR